MQIIQLIRGYIFACVKDLKKTHPDFVRHLTFKQQERCRRQIPINIGIRTRVLTPMSFADDEKKKESSFENRNENNNCLKREMLTCPKQALMSYRLVNLISILHFLCE